VVSGIFQQAPGQIDAEGIISVCSLGTGVVTPMVVAWGLGLFAIRLAGPRPTWRRLGRQPGMMAVCATVLVLAAFGVVIGCIMLVRRGAFDASMVVEGTLMLTPMFLGLAVAASWMTLLVGRRWRAERSWVDRAGRALGCFHIVAGLLMIYLLAMQTRGMPFTTYTSPSSLPSGPAPRNSGSPAEPVIPADETPSESETP
jgi:hypothetical protein